MSWVLTSILTHVPLWVWVALALGVLLALYGVWHLGLRQILVVAVLLGIGLIWPAAARSGWKAKERRDMEEAQKAIDRAVDARKRQEAADADPNHLRDNDGNRRD